MTDLPGYYMPHCTNCMASTHSAHHCPYNNDDGTFILYPCPTVEAITDALGDEHE